MRIEASQLSLTAAHWEVNSTAVIDQVVARRNEARDSVRLSDRAQVASERDDLDDLDPKQRLAVLALQALLGHRIRFLRYRPAAQAGEQGASRGPAPNAEVHRRTEIHTESEQTTFRARGAVETSDGRTIQFSVELNLQRAFRSETTTVGSGKKTDPLVVNFGGAPAQLTAAKVAFDLNGDGTAENISFVASGSGFLALDRNGDGKVNDGQELFGPQTGNGFSELAAYDADGNGWIDEGDPVFSQLRIWTEDGLTTLAQRGIGAIATGSVETPFALKDASNALLGNVRATGVFLKENGTAGTVEQVDLAG